MTLQTGHPYDISDDFVDTLRNAYARGNTDEIPICDKSETAMAYALDELGHEQSLQFGPHLQSCRECLALVFDVRFSLEEAAELGKVAPELDPEISAALDTSKSSESVLAPRNHSPSIRSKISSYFFSPKLVAALAVGCIAFFILTTVPIGKNTDEDFDVVRKKITQTADKQKPVTKIFKLRLNPADSKPIKSNEKPAKKVKSPWITPLEKIELKNLKLMGIMLSAGNNIAIVKDHYGKEYIVAKGTRIGINSGHVIRITGQKIIIEEQARDTNGDFIKVTKELTLQGDRKS